MKKTITFILIIIGLYIHSQGYTSYFTGNATNITVTPTAGYCLMGGATENDNAMKWFLQKANGGDILVLRSSGSNGYNNYFYSELGVTVNSVESIVITSVEGATNPYVIDKINKAEAIWFAGGNQANYVNYFKNNAFNVAINNHINVKQGVIGGTSAGMAILGSHYFSAMNGSITSSDALQNPYHPNVTIGKNDFLTINILQNTITDTHFDNPDRRGRLSSFLARIKKEDNVNLKGIASEEYTAVCIEGNGIAKVFGSFPSQQDYAYFVFPNCENGNPQPTCVANIPLTWNFTQGAYKVYKVPGTQDGQYTLDLNNWTTGNGGTWYNWNVINGSLSETSGTVPNCLPLSENDTNLNSITYNNPIDTFLNINSIEQIDIEIYNILGEKVLQKDQITNQSIDLSHLKSGIYFMKVSQNNSQKTLKLIKK
jgi:cyanophycinase-like exopeptidase